MGLYVSDKLCSREIIRRTLKYVTMFILSYFICTYTPQFTSININDVFIISFAISCCFVIIDIYFPIIYIESSKNT